MALTHPEPDLTVVAVFPNRMAAELAQGVLQGEGIDAAISADDAGGLYSSLWVTGVRVLVRSADLEKAQTVLAAG